LMVVKAKQCIMAFSPAPTIPAESHAPAARTASLETTRIQDSPLSLNSAQKGRELLDCN
jgi:hypothetical protein